MARLIFCSYTAHPRGRDGWLGAPGSSAGGRARAWTSIVTVARVCPSATPTWRRTLDSRIRRPSCGRRRSRRNAGTGTVVLCWRRPANARRRRRRCPTVAGCPGATVVAGGSVSLSHHAGAARQAEAPRPAQAPSRGARAGTCEGAEVVGAGRSSSSTAAIVTAAASAPIRSAATRDVSSNSQAPTSTAASAATSVTMCVRRWLMGRTRATSASGTWARRRVVLGSRDRAAGDRRARWRAVVHRRRQADAREGQDRCHESAALRRTMALMARPSHAPRGNRALRSAMDTSPDSFAPGQGAAGPSGRRPGRSTGEVCDGRAPYVAQLA